MIKSSQHRKQLGLSLIEMLVVMILGVFITIGISSVYVGNKRSSMTTDELSLLQANGRSVLHQLTQVIQHTGYKATRSPLGDDMFITGPVATSMCSDGSDSVVNSALFSTTQNNTPNGDTIGVVYLGDDLLTTDCTGTPIPAACRLAVGGAAPTEAAKIYNYFKADVNASGTPVLTCSGSLNAIEEEIAEGVENLQFSYGQDADGDGVPDRFVSSDNVTNWSGVVSVNVAVLVRSLRPVATRETARVYQLLDDTIVNTNDKFLRAVFTTTIRLRNATS